MEDIAPQLLETLRTRFSEKISANPKIRSLEKKIEAGLATYVDAEDYSYLIGKALSEVFMDNLSSAVLPDGRMYFNIAQRVLQPLLEEDYDIVTKAATTVQTFLNQKANIGIKAQAAPINEDRIYGIVNKVAEAASFDDVKWVLNAPVVNYSMNVVDEILRSNVNFQGRSSLVPKVVRRSERKCCKWCSDLDGVYDYPMIPDDVYRRHERCRCTVEYDPADGKRRRQNVHTKQWTDESGNAILEERKKIGFQSVAADLVEHPGKLASITPEQLVERFKNAGLEIKPLKHGSLKNIPFSEGGGFKVNFEDGGLFQYHPVTKSHHGGAYYKISTGKGGTKRYGMDGVEIKD